ncbi:MAG: DnaJ domain-containing protein [Planctomycetota bacterium]|nr:DnaJ domain-containing protein [Planctomycetota bacterium]
MAKRDFYEILGVSKTAPASEIKSAYRKLARKLHPDATKNDAKSTERFKEVQEAYEVLSDDTKRKNYDEFGHAGVGAMPSGSAGDPFEAYRSAQRGRGQPQSWQGGPGVSVEDFDMGGDFGSVFDQLFGNRAGARGGNARTRAKPAPQRGADIDHPVTLTFEQAARGTHLPLQINRDGKLETIDIRIPGGVKDGSRVRVKGRGQQSPAGEHGDLFIVTSVTPHAYFRRDGLDVHLDFPISMYEALLGAKIDVPTLDGRRTLTIPPGTSGGAKLRIKGHGITRGEEKGDQIVMVRVMVPRALDDEDKKSIEQLAAKHPLTPRADLGW